MWELKLFRERERERERVRVGIEIVVSIADYLKRNERERLQ